MDHEAQQPRGATGYDMKDAVVDRTHDRDGQPGPGSPDPRRWSALVVLLVGAFLPPLDFFIVNVALPSIRDDLQASPGVLQLVISGYATAYAVFLITGGRLGDIYGRRRVFLAGLVGFAASSALSGLAPSAAVLIAGRICQGMFAAVMAPQPLASIRVMFPEAERPRALGLYGAAFGAASAAGLLLGGALISSSPFGLGWRAIFLVNLPVVAITAPLALALLTETRAERPERLDIGGAALIAAALFLLVLPLVEGRQKGWPAWSLVMLAAAPPVMAGFWYHERRLAAYGGNPLVVPALLAVPGMKRGLIAAFFFYALAAFWLFFSVYEQSSRGRTAFETGVDILPAAAGFLIGPFLSAPLGRRIGRWTAPLGMALQAAGLLGTAAAILSAAPSWLPFPLLAIGFGQGLALPALTREITVRAPQRWAGLAAGLVSSMFQIGGALAVALIGGLFYSLLGADGAGVRLAQAYSVAMACIAASLLFAAGLAAGLPRNVRTGADDSGVRA